MVMKLKVSFVEPGRVLIVASKSEDNVFPCIPLPLVQPQTTRGEGPKHYSVCREKVVFVEPGKFKGLPRPQSLVITGGNLSYLLGKAGTKGVVGRVKKSVNSPMETSKSSTESSKNSSNDHRGASSPKYSSILAIWTTFTFSSIFADFRHRI